jgi:hypothetical protein
MSDKTGGPAFPHTVEYKGADCGGVVPHGGMSLRDYFAAKAMPATMAEFDDGWKEHAYQQETFLQWAAERAYAMADAMLKAREK